MIPLLRVLGAGLLVLGTACKTTSPPADTAQDTTTVSFEPSSAFVLWSGGQITFRTTGGSGGFWFGIAETRSCQEIDCWTGESCIWGYISADGIPMDPYCHYADQDGLVLEYSEINYDENGDGRITSDEWGGSSLEWSSRDEDGDNILTEDEVPEPPRDSLEEGYTAFTGKQSCGVDRNQECDSCTSAEDANCEQYVTYYLESSPAYGGTGGCWVWGHATSYYEGLGCTTTLW